MTISNRISKGKQKKIKIVEQLNKDINEAKSIVFTDYRGLTNKKMEELRNLLENVGAKFMVVKNTLLRRALENSPYKTVAENLELEGPTAAIIAKEDELSPLKKLTDFTRELKLPKIKSGFFFGKSVGKDKIQELAKLPERDVLLAMLIARMKGPLYGLHYALSWEINKLVWALEQVRKDMKRG